MPTHAWTRAYLALLDCNVVILDSVFVHWPLGQDPVFGERRLDGKRHCLWGPAWASSGLFVSFQVWYQQGVLHRTDGPADCYSTFPQWASWWVRGQKIDPPTHAHATTLRLPSSTNH